MGSAAWRGRDFDLSEEGSMKLVCVSDTHGQEAKLSVPDGDILVHCGDFSNMGTEKELISFAGWLKRQPHKQIFISPGNHDGLTQENPARAKEILENSRPGVRLMLHEAIEFGGLKWFLSPYTQEFSGWWWMAEEEELAQRWAEIPDDTQILVTHGPAFGILDTIENQPDYHAGSKSLLERIGQLKDLRHFFSGHLHHTNGQSSNIGGIIFTNAAVLNDRNQLCSQPQVFDL